MTEKEVVLKAMENLPEQDAIEEAMERLVLLAKIEEGRRDIENGNFYTIEEVEAMLDEWLK